MKSQYYFHRKGSLCNHVTSLFRFVLYLLFNELNIHPSRLCGVFYDTNFKLLECITSQLLWSGQSHDPTCNISYFCCLTVIFLYSSPTFQYLSC